MNEIIESLDADIADVLRAQLLEINYVDRGFAVGRYEAIFSKVTGFKVDFTRAKLLGNTSEHCITKRSLVCGGNEINVGIFATEGLLISLEADADLANLSIGRSYAFEHRAKKRHMKSICSPVTNFHWKSSGGLINRNDESAHIPGYALAVWLISELKEHDVTVADDPVEEDFGWLVVGTGEFRNVYIVCRCTENNANDWDAYVFVDSDVFGVAPSGGKQIVDRMHSSLERIIKAESRGQ